MTMLDCKYFIVGYPNYRADSRFAPSQSETVLLCHDVVHWFGTSLESALYITISIPGLVCIAKQIQILVKISLKM